MSLFSERIKTKRIQKKLTQQQVANELGISRVTYTNYEKDRREPSIEILNKLANLYETSIDYLTGRY